MELTSERNCNKFDRRFTKLIEYRSFLVAERLEGGAGEEPEWALHEELLLRRSRHFEFGAKL